METEEQSVDQLAKKTKISFPIEIIDEILSRLPVKSILRFRSVSKPWLSRISDPSFTKLHFTRATVSHRTGLFISTYDNFHRQRHFLSAARDGESVNHLMTLDDACSYDVTEAQHLNGLVFYNCMKSSFNNNYLFVLNPSTHKIFQIPNQASMTIYSYRNVHNRYLFGFDESRNEHKILNIRELESGSSAPLKTTKVEIMIFCMSNYSWRTIDAEPPVGFSWDRLHYDTKGSACVNSVMHLLLRESFDILAFDIRNEKFSIICTPQGIMPHGVSTVYTSNRETFLKCNKPFIMKISETVGVVCHDLVVEKNEMHIWMLQDYENRVWVKEIVSFPKPWTKLDCPVPLDVVNADEIMFSSSRVSGNAVRFPIYNMKSRRFKSLRFTLDHQFICPEIVQFDQIKCYVESIVPL